MPPTTLNSEEPVNSPPPPKNFEKIFKKYGRREPYVPGALHTPYSRNE